ncbi:MAG: adenylosuccinate lyase [Phycisphaerae bacterium]|nr:adenylosuccinate lyase [Phycisphaerae bacterium]
MSESDRNVYRSPLVARNASPEMAELFGERAKYVIHRKLWLALAQAQSELGLPITDRQIRQLRANVENIDFDAADKYERELRHETMAHIHAYGDVAPAARGIIHLGATSCYALDNTDLIILRQGMEILAARLATVIDALATFAKKHRSLPCLGFTHYQAAQMTTVGKRAVLWCYDFVRDLDALEHRLATLRFRGVKGTTGTQASFLKLFNGSHAKVERLEKLVARKMGFKQIEPVTGQTYSRKVDAQIVCDLAGIATSVHKLANDMRLLSNLKEMEEPFAAKQVGSSAMAYKRNPMRCERATALSRFIISLASSPLMTAAEQWFERTLDDSANRRITLAEAFLATDGCLLIIANVASGMVVYPKVIHAHVMAELPFMATENVLMAAVEAGGDRQDLHERIRQHSNAAGMQVKMHGKPNDLIERLQADPAFANIPIKKLLDPKAFIGRAPQQVDAFLKDYVAPIRRRYRKALGGKVELKV